MSFNYQYWLLWPLVLGSLCCQPSTRPQEDETEDVTFDISDTIPEDELSPDIPIGWVDLGLLDTTIVFDLRYATTDNFVSEQLYPCARCLLRNEVADAIRRAQRLVQTSNLRLKIFDCYRPLSIQQKLWDKVPDARYVTPPDRGSMHNRGIAIDVTLVDSNDMELDMGTEFDYFGTEAHHTYRNLSPEILDNRKHLLEVMQLIGFQEIRTEWWHYSYKDQEFDVEDFVWPCPD